MFVFVSVADKVEIQEKEKRDVQNDASIKYILEVFGTTALRKTSITGVQQFKDCKSNTNCYITQDEDFFGPRKFDKFDAVVFKPGNLRSDKVNY